MGIWLDVEFAEGRLLIPAPFSSPYLLSTLLEVGTNEALKNNPTEIKNKSFGDVEQLEYGNPCYFLAN